MLLDRLRAFVPDMWPMACLMGLAGLRMQEAAALRVQDVDLIAKAVTVCDTGRHRPKTRDSFRTVPICSEVVEALKVGLADQKVRPASGEIFVNKAGNPWERQHLSQRWTKVMRRAVSGLFKLDSGGILTKEQVQQRDRMASIPARKMRAAFATVAGRLGVQDRLLKAYLGHSSGDMLGGHYRRIALDELRSVSGLMEQWRGTAVRKHSGNISQNRIAEG
jgi:integrase